MKKYKIIWCKTLAAAVFAHADSCNVCMVTFGGEEYGATLLLLQDKIHVYTIKK